MSAEELAAVREELHSINAFAEIIESVHSVVDLDRILGVSSFSVEQTLEVDPTFLRDAPPTPSFFKKGGLRSAEASKKRPPPRKRHDLSGAHTHHARTHDIAAAWSNRACMNARMRIDH